MVVNLLKAAENSLYEQDFCLWLKSTAQLLKNSNFQALDLPNLIEEIEAMGRSEERAIYSNLKVLLQHLLKYRYQPERRSKSWKATIREHLQRIKRLFKDSPTLKNYFREILTESYQHARKIAADETGLAVDAFPIKLPFTVEEILDAEYLPE